MLETRSPASTPTGSDVKYALEIEKLHAEVRVLQRPYRNPAVIISLILAGIGIASFVLQLWRSDRDYQLAQIRTEKLELKIEQLMFDASRLEKQRQSLIDDIAARNVQLATIKSDAAAIAESLRRPVISDTDLKITAARLRNAADNLGLYLGPYGKITASTDFIAAGEAVSLSWISFNATDVVITPGIGPVAPSGSIVVRPPKTTTFTIVMRDPRGASVSSTVKILVHD